jgi:hypothetical protein
VAQGEGPEFKPQYHKELQDTEVSVSYSIARLCYYFTMYNKGVSTDFSPLVK